MDKITSIAQLQELILYIRNLRQGFVTNFYLDETKHAAWIETGNFQYDKYDDTVMILFDHYTSDNEKYFTNMFYISISNESMIAHLKKYPEMYHYDLYVLDIVGRDMMCTPIVEQLKTIRARHAATLVRMNRIRTEEEVEKLDERVKYAEERDVEQIYGLLHSHFDERLEQLPLISELNQMIAEKHILKCLIDEQIAGILLFDLNSSTLYLRYWLTLPEYRDKGVGSALLRRFFYEGRETKRQILWVREDNANAIERYEHYGFSKENMYDYILSYCG